MTDTTHRAGRREWLGLAVLTLPTLLVALDISVLFLAMPALSADLGASSVQQLWITDSYGFLVAGFLITMGTLGDRIGRRKLLLIGAAAFAGCSVVAAFAPNPGTLIAARALLGIAGATLGPSTLALISTLFKDAKQRGTAISVWALCQFGGAALGPVVGGVLLAHFWWGSVFLLGVPVMLVLLVLGPLCLPEYRAPAPGKLDLVSVALSLAAVLLAVWGIKELAAANGGKTLPLISLVAGLAFGFAFLHRQGRLRTPLLELSLFRIPRVGTVLIAMLATASFMAGSGMLVSQQFQLVFGQDPLSAALWFAPMGLGLAVGALLTPMLVRRVSERTAMVGGLALGVPGFVLVATGGGLLPAALGLAIVALGNGPLVALGTGLVVGSVPPERAGSAASTSETGLNLGATLGMALLGTAAAVVFKHSVHVPAGAPTETAETLAGAEQAARSLDPASAHELLVSGQTAFTAGVTTTAWLSAAAFAVLTVVVGLALRRKTGVAAAPSPAASSEEKVPVA